MRYQDAISQIWRHTEFNGTESDSIALVRYATLAASSHNTQPWKFKLEAGKILILPDFSRRCPEVDPDDHHLYGSLGCAAENLLLAAEAAGLRGHCSSDAKAVHVRVDLEKAPPSRSQLFEVIPKRQCTRTAYDGTVLSNDELRLLEQAGRGNGVSVMLLTDARQKEQVAEFVAEGNRAQIADPRWSEEMRAWVRFNARDAVRTGDGLYGAAMGFPDIPGWLGNTVMRVAVSAKRQNDKDLANIRSSGAIAVVYSEVDDMQHWVEAGRCYERLALQAAALNLRTAFINQPVEVGSLRPQFGAFLGIGERRPDFVVRIGRGPEMPRSLRRAVEEVIV